jgi:hypothetical protein
MDPVDFGLVFFLLRDLEKWIMYQRKTDSHYLNARIITRKIHSISNGYQLKERSKEIDNIETVILWHNLLVSPEPLS